MFSHLPYHAALAGWLVSVALSSAAPVTQAASVGLQLAPGLSAEERATIQRQVADTLGGQAEVCETPLQAGASCNAPGAATSASSAAVPAATDWQTTSAAERSPSSRPLNREEASPLSSWMQQLSLEVSRESGQLPVLVLVRNGQIESGWLWREDVPLDSAPLVLRSERLNYVESGAVVGEFLRHSLPLDIEALRWLPRQWRGMERDGWHILRHGDLRSVKQPALKRPPLSAPSPWEFSR